MRAGIAGARPGAEAPAAETVPRKRKRKRQARRGCRQGHLTLPDLTFEVAACVAKILITNQANYLLMTVLC